MPRRPRIPVAAIVTRVRQSLLDENELAARERAIKLKRITPLSLAQYRSKVSVLRSFIAELGEPVLTKRLFRQFLVSLDEEGRNGVDSPAQLLSALRFLQNSDNLWKEVDGTCWANDADLDDLVAGICYNGKVSKRSVSGAIDAKKLNELKAYAKKTDQEHFINPLLIAYCAVLRWHQVAFLKTGALKIFDGKEMLEVEKDKRIRRESHRKCEVHDKRITKEGAELYRTIEGGRKQGLWLFDPKKWRYPDLLNFVKTAATELGWDTSLEWVIHSTRHGGAGDMIEIFRGEDNTVNLQMSSSMAKKYCQKNDERSKRARILQESKKVANTLEGVRNRKRCRTEG